MAATLDQLIQEPRFKKTQGFIGRTVGPGVNPSERYVIEPDKTRADYQLEPGVISLDPADTSKIKAAITYPGINDALDFQGAPTGNADRLYTSQYYTWDPFVDFDSFVNFSQYYWLENGPAVVNVTATEIPTSQNFTVTRANGVYSFDGIAGSNPTLNLLRGGNYTFSVAQNAVETINFRVQNQNTSAYLIDEQANPALTLIRGNTYVFSLNRLALFPFWIKTQPSTGTIDPYNTGVLRNGAADGEITFTVPQDAPDTLYYSCQTQSLMNGVINIVNGTPGTGSGFWIQTNRGVNGLDPTSPNISTRDVLGVINNGTDLGTVTFNVPLKNAQDYWYNLPLLSGGGTVDFVTDLKFNEINNKSVAQFNAQYGGIDGVTALNGRTLVFTNTNIDPEAGGWIIETGFDPLVDNATQQAFPGSYDSLPYSYTTPVPVSQYYNVWRINYVDNGAGPYIQLSSVQTIASLEKFQILFGEQWSNTLWYKNELGYIEQLPALTAGLDVLFYQDGTDPEIFGQIKLFDAVDNDRIEINEILGKPNYTSPNGVVFTNGLKVRFTGSVIPQSYASGSTTVTCTSTAAGLNVVSCNTTQNLIVGQEIEFFGSVFGGLQLNTTYYVRSIFSSSQFTVSTVKDGPAVLLTSAFGTMTAVASQDPQFYISGVGTAIELLPVDNYIVPEIYDAETALLGDIDYLTIERSSADLNAWSRSNRWFHIDVLNATGQYNDTPVVLNNDLRGKRPILQFRGGLRLYNMGTAAKAPVNVVDFTETDALSNIEGSTSYTTNDYTLVDGTRIVFGADEDPNVRNKIYVVNFISPDSTVLTAAADLQVGLQYTIVSVGTTDWNAVAGTSGQTYVVGDSVTVAEAGTGTGTANFSQPIIHLTVAADGNVQVDNCTVCVSGDQTGVTFWYNGTEWLQAQQKQSVQQAPLFDVFDNNSVSFGNRTRYPSSTFNGTKLLSYATGSGPVDPILNLRLRYLTISNVGDIVFDNNLYKDSFIYVVDNNSVVKPISDGFVYEYQSRSNYQRQLGWQTAAVPSIMRQQFKFVYANAPLKLDVKVLPNTATVIPNIQIFVESKFQDPNTYVVTTGNNSTEIRFLTQLAVDAVIEVEAISDQVSNVAFYQVPINLENNPLNNNSEFFTLGTIRSHYETICQNLTSLTGSINGANNTRDLGNIIPYGEIILQQSAPMTLAGYFMRSDQYNIFSALEFNSREYQKFKGQLLEAVTRQLIQEQPVSEILDTAIADITLGKIDSNPFYWSDMLPATSLYSTLTYTVSFISTSDFDTNQIYDYASANYRGMNVYLNDEILIRGLDYVVATNGPRITVLTALTIGDVITIQEYTTTAGTFVPNTPTKLGCYPSWRPGIITVATSSGTQQVIQGHDGSETPLFNDIRDDVLLEFETRIFNNLKLDANPVPLTLVDVLPGQFRTTGYSYAEINQILATNLLAYVGYNKLNYNEQQFNNNNAFTWNYSASTNRVDNDNLLGAWRGIYRYFYDTQQPQQAPWEMLGFTIKPDWWNITYGAGPYTAENLVLWDDIAAGYIADPANPRFDYRYARPASYGPSSEPPRSEIWQASIWGEGPYPQLQPVIPTNSQGQLLSPLASVVGTFDDQQVRKNWVAGDGGPVEASWWNSSDYPFAVMRLLALTRPAKFFALFADRDLYRYQEEFGQYLYNGRYRLNANDIVVYGNGVSKASYINWIVDYNRVSGQDSTENLQNDLSNLDVRLCYRMASFSDKQYIKLYTEKTSPNSTNTSLLIPDNSYDLLLYKNQPFGRSIYSAVVIQTVANGWSVFGYSTTRPYFNILNSVPTGKLQTFSVADTTIQVPSNYTQTVTQVPYGFTFTTQSAVADFLLSYGQLLEQQGFEFDNQDNGYVLDWKQMVYEFLYWSAQGWGLNSLINLNPLAARLSVTRPQAVVDDIRAQTTENYLLDENKNDLPTRDLNIVRLNNTFTIEPLTTQSLSYVDLRYTTFESMIVLNNASLFGDLIYEPTTGARQNRLYLIAATSTDWNGTVNAPGFVLNQNNIEEWSGVQTYTKGTIVKYKGAYWSAATIVQPSTVFNYNDWNQSDYTLIQQGLLPNLANKADQLINSYNINSANLEVDNDLLSYGLIGYRPRQYLTALNLDDVSQLNVYRQFLDSKGTKLSVDLLGEANLNKEVADYTVFENWAVQRSVYGANANRSFFDLRLNASLLDSNPSVVQVIQPNQDSEADQTIFVSDIWNSSFPLTSANILPTTTTSITDTALPSAGYVNLDDADITVFDINNPASLAANLNAVVAGTTIWVARINDYDWNIYRAQPVPSTIAHVCDNLNGTSLVKFNGQHNLIAGDKLIIRFFDSEIDGVYQVLTVPNLTTVTIAFDFTGNRTVANGTGIAFTLKTMRVNQASDVLDLPYSKEILPGAKVWVDNNGQDQWQVLKKQNPFVDRTVLSPLLLDASEQYGASVAQANNRQALFVGSPRYGFGLGTTVGGIYVYVKNTTDQYEPISPVTGADAVLTLSTTGVRGYGNAVDVGHQTWAVGGASASLGPAAAGSPANNGYAVVLWRNPEGGAPGSNPWQQTQVLVLPGTTNTTTPGAGEFGYSVAMSTDERWMYIGAPGLNYVYAYGQVGYQDQEIAYFADGVSNTVNISNQIQITNANQITVTQDGRVLTLTTEYTVNAAFTQVTFVTTPAAGEKIVITRNTSKAYTASGTTYNLANFLYTVSAASSGSELYAFYVTVDGVHQRPFIDYTYSAGNLVFYSAPTGGASIAITAETYYKLAASLTVAGLGAADRFGHSVTCSTDGRQLMVGCKNNTVDGLAEAGSVFLFDRNVQTFVYGQDPSTVSFTLLGTPVSPIAVTVNGVQLTNVVDGIPTAANTFVWNGSNTVTVNTDLEVGDLVEIETNQFVQQQKIVQNEVAEFSNYGQAIDLCAYNCSLYTGAPQSSLTVWKGGVVERTVNVARSYGSITATVANPALTVGDTLRVNNVDIEVPAATATVTSLQGLANNIAAYAPNASASISTDGYLTIYVTNAAAALSGDLLQVAPGSVITTTGVYAQLGFEAFAFAQTIESPIPTEMAAFGSSLSINTTASNLVVGSPQGSLYLPNTFDFDPVTEKALTTFDGNCTTFFSPVTQSGTVYTFDYLPSAINSLDTPGAFVFGQQVQTTEVSALDQYGTAVSYRSGVLVATAPGEDFGDSTAAYGAAFVFENPTQGPAWAVQYEQRPVVDINLLTSVYIYDQITSAKTEFFDFFDPLQGKILGAAQQNIDYIGAVDPAGYNVGGLNNRGTAWSSRQVGEMWWDISTVRFIDPNQDSITYASRRWGQVFPGSRVDVYQWVQSAVPPAQYAGPGLVKSIDNYVVTTKLSGDGTILTDYFFWARGITDVSSAQGKTLSAATVASYIQDPRASGIAYVAPINSSTIAIYNGIEYIVAADSILSIEFDQQYTQANVHAEYELIAQGRPDAFLSANLYRKLQDSFCGVDTNGAKVPDINLPPAQRYGIQFRPRQSMFVDRFAALKNYIQRANAVFALYPISENRSFNLLNSADPVPPATEIVEAGLFQTGQIYTIVTVGTTDFVAIGAASNTVGVTFVATGPGSGNGAASYVNWNFEVANLEILTFQNIYAVPLNYRYLVLTDSSNRGLWTIYTVVSGAIVGSRTLRLTKVQNYNTRDYWSYIDWYLPGYNSTSKILTEVPTFSALATVSAPVGASVKVTANAQGKFEIYLRTDTDWQRVGLQDGTIEISAEIYDYELGRFGYDVEVFDAQYFDQEPVIETRQIIQAINQELLIGDLLIERNRALILTFNFILSELQAPEWLVKTSLIDVDHRIRQLVPFQNYIRDNQEFVSDYIQEVKPYHVQIKEFNLTYNGQDIYDGSLTDFDLPAYYNTDLAVPQFVSPILLPYTASTAQSSNNLSNTPGNAAIWSQWPYSQWYNNYTLFLESISVVNPGTGYAVAPVVTIVAAAGDTTGTGAQAVATINAQGRVSAITVTDPGTGYTQTPLVVIDGGNPGGATAYARMNNTLVRSFRTVIKYDRYQYQTSVQVWSSDGTYENGELVRYDNRVWQANSADGSSAVIGPEFNLEDWDLVNINSLSGVNRTMGYYQPTVNSPGLDLQLLIEGTSYPGVQVWGNYFLGSGPVLTVTCTETSAQTNQITCDQTLRLESGLPIRFYGSVFGGVVQGQVYFVTQVVSATEFKISEQQDGMDLDLTTAQGTMIGHVSEPVDAVYASSFDDQFLGLRPTDINVDGGEFVGAYEGHAPEELINGSEYDTMDFRVYTSPGGDWTGRGHGFQIGTVNYNYDPSLASYSWQNVVDVPVDIIVYNLTTGEGLTPDINYTVDWAAQTISVVTGLADNDIIGISVYEVGGGNQLYRNSYTGSEANDTVIVPINDLLIYTVVAFKNGQYLPGVTWSAFADAAVWNINNTYAKQDIVENSGIYYRALRSVPDGILITNATYWALYVPATSTLIDFNTTFADDDRVTVAVMGEQTPQYSWSTPQTEYVVASAAQASTRILPVTNSLQGTNSANMIVTRNGVRLRPPEGIEWLGDDSSVSFGLPQRGNFSQALINPITDIAVWLDGELQIQNFGSVTGDYYVTNYDGSNTPGMQVIFFETPAAGARILISVSTVADYQVNTVNNTVEITPVFNTGDVFAITTFNDTTQQNILTLVFQGPVVTGITLNEPYDSTAFDAATVSGTSGSYDFTIGTGTEVNDFYLQRPTQIEIVAAGNFEIGQTYTILTVGTTDFTAIGADSNTSGVVFIATGQGSGTGSATYETNANDLVAGRLWVTLDGIRLIEGQDFTVQGQYLILSSGVITTAQVLVVTEFAESVVPETMEFRIFQDMRGLQTTYRMTPASSTVLVQPLTIADDVIYVQDVSHLSVPNLANGYFGIVTINGERILYRDFDLINNTVSGLQRGTAGTAPDNHDIDSVVYDMGIGNAMWQQDQNYVLETTSVGDDSTVAFSASNISILSGQSADFFAQSLEVYVGGTRARPGASVTTVVDGDTVSIAYVGNTDWHAMGLPSTVFPAPGVVFTADSAGTGTGLISDTLANYYYAVTANSPAQVTFFTADNLPAPAAGLEVTILQRRGVTWYAPGVGTPSNGEPLQLTETTQALFLQGK